MTSSISVRGTIKNIIDGNGFTISDAICESIDNSMDAATEGKKVVIQFRLLPENNSLMIVDNSEGMNETELENSTCIYDRKMDNENGPRKKKQGKYGLGLAALLLQLCEANDSTTTLTKKKDKELYQIKIDWPGAMEKNMYYPQTQDPSKKNLDLWDDIAIDKNQGTALIIPCTPNKFAQLDKMVRTSELFKKLGKTYSEPISDGVLDISFLYPNNDKFTVKSEEVLGYKAAPEKYKRTVEILCYTDKDVHTNIPVHTTYINLDGEHSKYEFLDKNSKLGSKLVKCNIPESSILVGRATLQTVVQIDVADCLTKSGGIYTKRNDKFIGEPYRKDFGKGGDHAKTDTRDNKTRSVFRFDVDLDIIAKTESNKSRHVFVNMEENLRKTIEELHYDFSKYVYEEYHPYSIQKKADAIEAKNAKALAKVLANLTNEGISNVNNTTISYEEKDYGLTEKNTVYDLETEEVMGIFDIKTSKILFKERASSANKMIKTDVLLSWIKEHKTEPDCMEKLLKMLSSGLV